MRNTLRFTVLRSRSHDLAIISIGITVLGLALLWISDHAVAQSHYAGQDQAIDSLADQGGLRPDATTITVNSLADVANASDGACTLREAITAANNNAPSGVVPGECAAGGFGSDTINMTGLTGTIMLTSVLPDIASDMTLTGSGPSNLTIQRSASPGVANFRIFLVPSGVTVNFTGFTVAGGKSEGGGGGIANIGALTLTNITVTNNQTIQAAPGGGIENGGFINGPVGTLTLINSTVSNNTSDGGSGGSPAGIDARLGTVTLINSIVSGNTTLNSDSTGGILLGGGGSANLILKHSIVSDNTGRGISNGGSTLIITDSTIRNNTGTGISNAAGSLTLTNSTVSGNSTISGGGVLNFGGATLINSTVSGNTATGGFGGGVYNSGLMSIVNCTVTGNTAGTTGGGIYADGFRTVPTTNLRNTIVAGNTIGSGGSGPDLGGAGPFTSQDYNLIGSISGGMGGTTSHNITNVNGLLGPLANNGGPTQTHALLANSPALDAGDNCVTQSTHCGDSNISQLTTDQRGFSRVVDGPDVDATGTIDMGAYELQPPIANLTDVSTNEDTQILIPFDPGDINTVASLTATSSNSTLVPNDALHLSAGITGSTGIITINPAANLFGTANITLTINRSGGGSEQKTFMLTVNSSNDAPSVTLGADPVVNEDAGAQTLVNWATNISPGPTDESGQTLNIQITGNTNASLFAVAPGINASGTLTFAPAADANGSATITVTVSDNGGTLNGGVDSTSRTFNITVTPVNDPPAFTKGPDQNVNNNAGARTVNNWATSISSGPANESTQTLSFQVTGNTNAALFLVPPAINSAGTLTYAPASNAGGSSTITINLKDNGGTANGGVDTSATQSFTITVTPVGGFIDFAATASNTTENSGAASFNVNRSGDTTRAVTVDYATNADNGLPCATANGIATAKCDFTAALGTLNFAAGETVKTITVLINQDSFVEGPETFTISLSNPTGFAAIGSAAADTITIADDISEPPTNVIDDAGSFVRQNYHDFLNREPDQSGLDFWTSQMTNCGSPDPTVCRVNVSGAFFLSIEFQQTGYLVERFYKVAYADATATSTVGGSHQIFVPAVRANEFLRDTQRISRDVIVLAPGWEQALENNKQAYATEFVQTSRFVSAYPFFMTPSQFVIKLNQNAGNVLSPEERTTAINLFGGSGNTANMTFRAQAVRMVAEDPDLYNAEFNRAFVLTQYIGYLRRNPNDAPESSLDYTGYDFWLSKLNQFNGNYVQAEMVKAFIASDEYRRRFGNQ